MHIGLGTLLVDLGVCVLFCVAPSDASSFAMAWELEEADHCSSLLSSYSTLSLILIDSMAYGLRETKTASFSLSLLYAIPSLSMMIGSKTGLSFLVGEH